MVNVYDMENEIIEDGIYYIPRDDTSQTSQQTWISRLQLWKKSRNERHQLVRKSTQPSISASTTATNLSDYQSNTTLVKTKMATLQENIRLSKPELEPLNLKEKNIGVELTIFEDNKKLPWECLTTVQKIRMTSNQLITALVLSWASMVIGYSSAFTSPADSSLRRDFHIGEDEMSWVGSFMPLGAVIGGVCGGPSIQHLGRKWTLLLTDSLFLVAWATIYFARDYYYLYLGRSLVGLGVGLASLTFPVYLGETIQPEVRGTLGLLPTTFGNMGILVCFLLGNIYDWKGLAAIATMLTLPFLIIFIWIIPETPRWYVSKDKLEECKQSLEWLRGKNQDITKEFDELVRSQKEQALRKNEKISDILTKANMKPLFICLSLMLFQQFSGINAIIFYTTTIFQGSGSTLPPLICTTIVGAVNMISTFMANALIDRLGRKILLYISSSLMAACLGILGLYYYLKDIAKIDVTDYGFVPLICLIVFALGFSLGFGPIPWLMMGEVLPPKIRGPAASIATSFNFISTFVVTKTFPLMKEGLGSCPTFWFYGIMTIIGGIYAFIFVPETRGKSLEDIERLLSGQKVKKIDSKDNTLASSF